MSAKQVHILVHQLGLSLTAEGVPFVDEADEFLACAVNDVHKEVHQVIVLLGGNAFVEAEQFVPDVALHLVQKPRVARIFGDEVGHIQIQNRITVQVLSEVLVPTYLQALKQLARVAGAVVIGIEHLHRHGFPKPAGTGHAKETVVRHQHRVNLRDEHTLIHKIRIADRSETVIAFVYIFSHMSLVLMLI